MIRGDIFISPRIYRLQPERKEMSYSEIAVFVMEIIGTIAFAVSGAMLGVRKGMDLFGVCILGVTTAVGGGMVRDVILGNVPSALLDPMYTVTAAGVSVLVFLWHYIRLKKQIVQSSENFDRIMLVMDAVGLGIFTVVGITAGIRAGYGDKGFLLVFLGTLTGVGGGLIRDMMAQEPPYILNRHIYACASIIGAVAYIHLHSAVPGEGIALIAAPLIVFLIRMLAAYYRWNLPRIRTSK